MCVFPKKNAQFFFSRVDEALMKKKGVCQKGFLQKCKNTFQILLLTEFYFELHKIFLANFMTKLNNQHSIQHFQKYNFRYTVKMFLVANRVWHRYLS
jgi:hypothetical protein